MRTLEQQIAVMDGVRASVLADPSKFDMQHWHSACNTSHCMAGWMQVNCTEDLPDWLASAEEIGAYLAPDFKQFFFGPTGLTLIWLRARGYSLKVGEVAKDDDSGFWVDGSINVYDGSLSQEAAAKQSSSNSNCTGCTDCTYCTGCTYCTDCTGCTYCTGCTDCTGCTHCADCTHCTGCTYCTDCTDCTGCTYCTYCTGCTYCTDCTGCTDRHEPAANR